jgi:predicted nucleic acid-binding protein
VGALNGLTVIGSAGILLAAKKQGRIARIAPILATWRSWGYFLSPALVTAILSRAGEDGE